MLNQSEAVCQEVIKPLKKKNHKKTSEVHLRWSLLKPIHINQYYMMPCFIASRAVIPPAICTIRSS